MIITIDGPTASGKSTVARMVAHELGFYYLASGMLFRALAYVLIHDRGYSINKLAVACVPDLDAYMTADSFLYTYDPINHEQVFYKEKALTPWLKTPEIDQAASLISADVRVRDYLLAMQHTIASSHDVVADGRDCGSVVFPQADLKIFLIADLEVRAERWQKDQRVRGVLISFECAKEELNIRDERDSSRKIAPLIIPRDAIIIDSSHLQAQQVVAQIVAAARKLRQ